MKLNRFLPALVALVSLLTGALLYQLFNQGPVTASNNEIELTAIPLNSLAGEASTIGDWRDQILVVNFWAPWCAPCRREIPTLIRLSQNYASKNVTVVGIALDGADAVRRFADEYQIDYPLFLAGNQITMYNAAFGNPSGSLPFTAIVDRQQHIVFQHNGEVTEDELRQQLEKLL